MSFGSAAARRAAVALWAVILMTACQASEEQPSPDGPGGRAVDAVTEEPATASPERPAGEEAPGGTVAQPDWAGPPDNVIAAPAISDPAVFEGEDVAVAVTGLVVYPTGAELRVTVRRHPETIDRGTGAAPAPIEDPMRIIPGASPGTDDQDDVRDAVPEDVLRLVVEYPDGRTADTVETRAGTASPGGEPEGPLLSPITSMGTPGRHDYTLWLWPLPEPATDPLEIVAEWPAAGIRRAGVEVDMERITAAADSAVELWRAP